MSVNFFVKKKEPRGSENVRRTAAVCSVELVRQEDEERHVHDRQAVVARAGKQRPNGLRDFHLLVKGDGHLAEEHGQTREHHVQRVRVEHGRHRHHAVELEAVATKHSLEPTHSEDQWSRGHLAPRDPVLFRKELVNLHVKRREHPQVDHARVLQSLVELGIRIVGHEVRGLEQGQDAVRLEHPLKALERVIHGLVQRRRARHRPLFLVQGTPLVHGPVEGVTPQDRVERLVTRHLLEREVKRRALEGLERAPATREHPIVKLIPHLLQVLDQRVEHGNAHERQRSLAFQVLPQLGLAQERLLQELEVLCRNVVGHDLRGQVLGNGQGRGSVPTAQVEHALAEQAAVRVRHARERLGLELVTPVHRAATRVENRGQALEDLVPRILTLLLIVLSHDFLVFSATRVLNL